MKYTCSICGYVYDEAAGIPESGIAPGTKFEELPKDFKCPLCGAPKELFHGENVSSQDESSVTTEQHELYELQELTAMEASVLCSNLARGCEKQYQAAEAEAFKKLAEEFRTHAAKPADASFDMLLEKIDEELTNGYPMANSISKSAGDRGAQRALVWSEKVTRILKSLLERYIREGDAMLENTGIYVCTICGFVYIGDTPPEICPVCKVTGRKFEKIEGGN